MTTLESLIQSCHVGSLSVESKVLQLAAEKRLAAQQEKAVEAVSGLFERFQGILSANVVRLREIRESEAKQDKYVKSIDRAFRFFGVTGNPLPLFKVMADHGAARTFCSHINVPVPADDSDAWDVPADFEKKSAKK